MKSFKSTMTSLLSLALFVLSCALLGYEFYTYNLEEYLQSLYQSSVFAEGVVWVAILATFALLVFLGSSSVKNGFLVFLGSAISMFLIALSGFVIGIMWGIGVWGAVGAGGEVAVFYVLPEVYRFGAAILSALIGLVFYTQHRDLEKGIKNVNNSPAQPTPGAAEVVAEAPIAREITSESHRPSLRQAEVQLA